MAKLVITFDTVSKEGSITMDDKEVADVNEINLYKYGEEWGLRVESNKIDEEQKMSTRSIVYAELSAGQEDNVVESIHSYFGVE